MDFDARKRDDQIFLSASVNVKTTVEDQIAEGNKFASRVVMRCTHAGTYQSVSPTGKRVIVTFVDIATIKAGRIYEEWVEFSTMSILKQIGRHNVQITAAN